MNYEIKEILDMLKRNESIIAVDDEQLLLDYIINLQQENEKLKDNAIHNDKVVDKARWNEMIYKSRVEKAIEYIKEHIRIDDEYPTYMEMLVEERDNLLNILQNGSESNE